MNICLATPAPPHSRHGNRVTALRWARILRGLGHRVMVAQRFAGQRCDLLIALHARKSFPSVVRFRQDRPRAPLIVALTGTDLYGDLPENKRANKSVQLATRLIVLQENGVNILAPEVRKKTRVIYQSVNRPRGTGGSTRRRQDVCVLGHLRPVKDPFRAAMAARLLPRASRLRIVHAGRAMSEAMARRATRETDRGHRYRWLGDRPRWRAMRLLAQSRLLVVSSKMEGGANIVSEALAVGTPVIATRIDGNIGMLGRDYPGYFPVGDTRALAEMLWRAESDSRFYHSLRAACRKRAPLIDPRRECRSWASLLDEIGG